MSLSLEIARRALDASRARAREFGCQVSIALVDSAGHLVAFERMMAPYAWATAGIATAKATSAVMFNQSTSDISRWAGDIPGFATSMASMTQGKFIMAPGGWPIRGPNGVTVGAIGISGGNAPGRDDDIARAGVHAAEAALQADFQRRMQAQAAAQAPAAQPVPAAAPAASAFQAPPQPQAAPATVELSHPEPAASVYMPVVTPESAQSSAAPADSQASSEDDQPTITVEPQR
ncbi:MAG TPA: heme-binding protein [Ktedonobacterales bacterium]